MARSKPVCDAGSADGPRAGELSATGSGPDGLPAWPGQKRLFAFLAHYNTPLTLGCAVLIFLADALSPRNVVLGPAYVIAVLLSLWVPKIRGTFLVAALCTAFVSIDLLLDAQNGGPALTLNHLLAIAALWLTALLCLWRRGRVQHEARVIAQAERALHEARQIQRALVRAEAAESDARQLAERLELTQRAGGVGSFDMALRPGDASYFSSTLLELVDLAHLGREPTADEWLGLLDDADRARWLEQMRASVRNHQPFDFEYRVTRRDGTARWLSTHAEFQYGPNGRALRFIGAGIDVTRSKEAEDARRLAEARLERAVRGTHDGPWEYDLLTDHYWVAPYWRAMLGYTEDELPTTREVLTSLIHPDDVPAQQSAFQSCLEGLGPYDVEFRVRTRSGEYRWFRSRGSCDRDQTGRPIRVSGALQDVTERRQYQRALIEATQAADAANRAKSEFLANMSHEIRTPMNGVIGMTELLLDSELQAAQRDYTETIRDSAAALLTVINDILDFSKIEAGKLDLEHIEADLRGIIEDVTRLLAIQARAKGLALTSAIDAAVPARVVGDPARLRQILVNLGGNAVKFTAHGEVAISARVAETGANSALVRFEVRDTGPGIPRQRQAALFRPFSQVDASTTRRFGGTGLGLSIVKRLAELMGGSAGVDSDTGLGSTFWFTARLGVVSDAPPAAGGPAAAPGTSRVARRILLAEDNAVNQKVARTTLEKLGHEVTVVGNGREAVAAWKSGHFDLILMDCQMPELDGYEATREIRRRERAGEHIPIVALTAHAMKGDDFECRQAGMDDYLTKPLDRARLSACLDSHLDGRRG